VNIRDLRYYEGVSEGVFNQSLSLQSLSHCHSNAEQLELQNIQGLNCSSINGSFSIGGEMRSSSGMNNTLQFYNEDSLSEEGESREMEDHLSEDIKPIKTSEELLDCKKQLAMMRNKQAARKYRAKKREKIMSTETML
jgi:hypothetical protein